MPRINRPPVNSNNDDEHHEALIKRHRRNDMNQDTSINYTSFLFGSTVAAHQEDGGPWTHGTVVGRGDHNHNRLHMIHITKTGKLITGNSKHVKAAPITAEQYPQD